jgi:hypothetical protein
VYKNPKKKASGVEGKGKKLKKIPFLRKRLFIIFGND